MAYIPKKPLIAVIGATGTGKSKLAVALAKRFGGEIINGDALQIYEGLPIVTNKIREHEMCNVEHHLLGRIGLGETTWSVSEFTTEALKVIESIRSRGKLPILVGGTHYYTQSLLLQGQNLRDDIDEKFSTAELEEKWPILKGTEEEILAKLWEVDPAMAARWHPKDCRKIRRSLEIWLQSGRRASDLYASQRENAQMAQLHIGEPSTPRHHDRGLFPHGFESLTFCTFVEHSELERRIWGRVDQMLEEGLMDEIHDMYARYKELLQSDRPPDLTRGIWIAIGYKEFAQYLSAQDSGAAERDELKALKMQAVERMKISTRQYAKSQMKWIRRKLLPPLLEQRGQDAAVLLTYNDTARWHVEIEEPAIAFADAFIHGHPLDIDAERREALARLIPNATPKSRPFLPVVHTCGICGVTMTTQGEVERHPRTSRHKRAVRAQRGKPWQGEPAMQIGGSPTHANDSKRVARDDDDDDDDDDDAAAITAADADAVESLAVQQGKPFALT